MVNDTILIMDKQPQFKLTFFHYVLMLFPLWIGVLILAVYGGLNYSGFCFEKMRYLSNEEKIQSVFNAYNSNDKIPVETSDRGTQFYRHIQYKNFEEFTQKNPNCCQVNPGGPYDLPPPEFLDRITGFHSGDTVVLNFKVYYLDENNQKKSKIAKTESVLKNCGKIKW
jgi:hypothetical protein